MIETELPFCNLRTRVGDELSRLLMRVLVVVSAKTVARLLFCIFSVPAATVADLALASDGSRGSEGIQRASQFSFTLISSNAPGFATAQSNNQLIVANRKGIFFAYLDTF